MGDRQSSFLVTRKPESLTEQTRRKYDGHEYVYCVISQRAKGLSVGINLNLDKFCNFDCRYCEVDRTHPGGYSRVPVIKIVEELQETLAVINESRLQQLGYTDVPEELLVLKEIALSGDGEPTLCPNFQEVVAGIVQLRNRLLFPFFKIVLITNGSGLHLATVRAGLEFFDKVDEIWAKLDVGTQSYMNLVNRSDVPLKKILRNIRNLGRKRPIIIQSLFASMDGDEPAESEIEAYAESLRNLKADGTNIPLVQIYSAHRVSANPRCGHLPLHVLSKIARRVREVSGLDAEVF